jgi:hypothetical protein
VDLKRGPLRLMRINEELLDWKSSGSGQENRINYRGDRLRWPRDTLYPQKFALTSPTSDGPSVGVVRLRTKSTDFVFRTFTEFYLRMKMNEVDTEMFIHPPSQLVAILHNSFCYDVGITDLTIVK